MNVVNRSTGTTASERYLAQLADHTFLKLWAYPNVFNDKRADQVAMARSFAIS